MVSILAHAQNLVYTLLSLMPSVYQQKNLESMLGLFLQAQGYPLPQHSKSKSASAFTNLPDWGQAAEIAFQTIFPHLVILLLLQDIERLRDVALSQGIDIHISRCKI